MSSKATPVTELDSFFYSVVSRAPAAPQRIRLGGLPGETQAETIKRQDERAARIKAKLVEKQA